MGKNIFCFGKFKKKIAKIEKRTYFSKLMNLRKVLILYPNVL